MKKHSVKLTETGTEVLFQYSPESFSATETEFAVEICEAVMDVWKPTPERKIIINLPETVEVAMPNVYADQIEYFCRYIKRRDCAVISVHTHNDRGTGVASAQLAMLAGADRVEGTLFGNGERTGNCDIVTVAFNMFTRALIQSWIFLTFRALLMSYERCTGMKVPPRQPYSGELVFTAFSGSHQDAISKGLKLMEKSADGVWDVPYLVMDPRDAGRKYKEVVIRVNGQSGKGGIAYLLEQGWGIHMPKDLQREFGAIAGKKIDALGREVTAGDLKEMFLQEYVEREVPYKLVSFRYMDGQCESVIICSGKRLDLHGSWMGQIHAFIQHCSAWIIV